MKRCSIKSSVEHSITNGLKALSLPESEEFRALLLINGRVFLDESEVSSSPRKESPYEALFYNERYTVYTQWVEGTLVACHSS